MTQPIPVRVLRHKCPFCPRTHARPVRAREHIARCWYNPEARGCKTCKHFEPAEGDSPDWTTGYGGSYTPEDCAIGIDLTGRPQCKTCGGHGDVSVFPDLGMTECPDCAGDGAEIKPGPIVGCDQWEPEPEERA